MDNTIFYFSSTGNSLKVAKDIAELIGKTELIPITKDLSNMKPRNNCVGFVFPVYYYGLPIIVKNFISELDLRKSGYYFAIATYGRIMGETLVQASKLFKCKGASLSLGFGIKMPGNYTPLHGAISDKRQQVLFDEEKKKVKTIANCIKEKQTYKLEKSNIILNKLLTTVKYKSFEAKVHVSDINFSYEYNCGGCAICQRICPVKNISLINGKPQWNHKCERCLACLQWCPKQAIQYGNRTLGRKRYHHPSVNLKDIIV